MTLPSGLSFRAALRRRAPRRSLSILSTRSLPSSFTTSTLRQEASPAPLAERFLDDAYRSSPNRSGLSPTCVPNSTALSHEAIKAASAGKELYGAEAVAEKPHPWHHL